MLGKGQNQDVVGRAYDSRLMKRLLRYLVPYRFHVALAVLLLLSVSFLQLLGPYLTKVAIDRYIAAGDLHGLTGVALLLLAFLFLGFWIDFARTVLTQWIGVLEQGRHWLVNDHYTKKEILLDGMGWGRLQQHLISRELEEGKLVPLEIERYESSIDIEIRVARRLGSPPGPVAIDLWEKFRESAKE